MCKFYKTLWSFKFVYKQSKILYDNPLGQTNDYLFPFHVIGKTSEIFLYIMIDRSAYWLEAQMYSPYFIVMPTLSTVSISI